MVFGYDSDPKCFTPTTGVRSLRPEGFTYGQGGGIAYIYRIFTSKGGGGNRREFPIRMRRAEEKERVLWHRVFCYANA